METNKYTFYWLSGKREVLWGTSPADAANCAGYGAGAMHALDFYAEGVCTAYEWRSGISTRKYWQKKEVADHG